ncbi:MAG TPA: hypothetical protein VIL46_01715, partial [Gemmataceae bacterium]
PYGMRFAETYARDYDVYLRRIMSDPLEIRDPLGRSVLTAGLCGLFTLILTLSYVGMLGKARAAIKKRLPED